MRDFPGRNLCVAAGEFPTLNIKQEYLGIKTIQKLFYSFHGKLGFLWRHLWTKPGGQWPANVQIICKHGEITRLKIYRKSKKKLWKELNQKKITISQEKLIICPACWIFDEILTWLKYLNSLCEMRAGEISSCFIVVVGWRDISHGENWLLG